MSTWRIVTRSVDDKPGYTYGPGQVHGDGGIVGFPSFDVDASGNCISLTFDAVSSRNDIKPRELLTVERYNGTAWVPWWKGMVTTIGTIRSDQVQRYTALGLKQYFYERVLDTPRWPEQPDVSTDAANLPEFTELNAEVYGVTRTSASTPELGFSIGVALPYRQMMGEFLDQRANQVGAFVVPSGEYYEYDGLTYYAGETVPAVRWGVNENGLFFFRRPAASQVQVNETDPEVEVTWAPKSTEGKANTIDFTVIADVDRERLLAVKAQQAYSGPPGYFGGSWTSTERTFIPLSTRRPSGNPVYPVIERRYQVSNPLDLMGRLTLTFRSNSLWSNISNATDSDPLTYAAFGGTFTPITATGGTVTTVGDYTVHTFTTGGTFTVSSAGSNPDVEYLIVAGGGGGGTSNSGAASGGGAGGMQTGSTTVTATSYTITVGAGGNGAVFGTPITNAQKGGNSSAFGVTAEGGGRGTQGTDTGKSGGSGSGAARESNAVGTTAGGTGNAGEGNDGGTASTVAALTIRDAAAGGGGAGGAAPSVTATASADAAGAGGIGLESTISGSAVTYATGGAGRVASGGGASGAANTGNGGEGAIGGGNGGGGGSGIVIIRYRSVAPAYTRALGTPFDFSSPSVLSTTTIGGLTGVGAYVISYSSDEPLAVAIRRQYSIGDTIDVPPPTPYDIVQTSEVFFEYQATNTDSEIRVQTVIIPALSPSSLGGDIQVFGTNTLFIYGVTGLRIYDAAFYRIDDDVVTRVAEGLIQDPNSEAAVVDVQGFSPVATEVEITTIDPPSPVTMPVERIEYAITSQGGITTRYYAGQKFDPELQTEAAVIDGAIRRLTGALDTL